MVASGRWGPSIEGSPCLTGQRCDAWDDHYYRTPDVMAGMGHQYDDYNRSWPDVFVGEFAANVGHQMTLQAAVAEAVFVLGFESNGDKVKSASFAPMLNNVNGTQWGYNLINFDSSRLFALPSYYMQQMYREAAGEFLLKSTLSSAGVIMATAAAQGSDLVLKFACYSPNATDLSISLSGFTEVAQTSAPATLQILSSAAGATAGNSLSNPTAVAPTTTAVKTGASFDLLLPAWSIAVLRIPGAV